MLPQFKFEDPLIEMQVLQSGMDGSQINNNHLPAAMATPGYSEVSKYFLSYT